jgi:hypothetical protein
MTTNSWTTVPAFLIGNVTGPAGALDAPRAILNSVSVALTDVPDPDAVDVRPEPDADGNAALDGETAVEGEPAVDGGAAVDGEAAGEQAPRSRIAGTSTARR